MVSFVSRGMVNKVIRFSPSIISPRELFTSHLFSSRFLSPARIMMLDMLTSCFSFLTDVTRSIIDLAIFSGDLSDDRSFVQTCKMKWSGLLLTNDFTYSCMHAYVQFFWHFPSISHVCLFFGWVWFVAWIVSDVKELSILLERDEAFGIRYSLINCCVSNSLVLATLVKVVTSDHTNMYLSTNLLIKV